MVESTTVTVGLDVHARSIRLATIRADELLEERTLPYDEEQWSGCCAAGRRCAPAMRPARAGSASTGASSIGLDPLLH